MIDRLAQNELAVRLRKYPAAALVGPRQSGKTTLARAMRGNYFDLEQPAERLRLDLVWDQVVAAKDLIILDEAQESPDVFPRLRGAIDSDRARNGRFLLLGSVSPTLMHQVAESLAGRLSLLELSPLLASELAGVPVDQHWMYGGYHDGGVFAA